MRPGAGRFAGRLCQAPRKSLIGLPCGGTRAGMMRAELRLHVVGARALGLEERAQLGGDGKGPASSFFVVPGSEAHQAGRRNRPGATGAAAPRC